MAATIHTITNTRDMQIPAIAKPRPFSSLLLAETRPKMDKIRNTTAGNPINKTDAKDPMNPTMHVIFVFFSGIETNGGITGAG